MTMVEVEGTISEFSVTKWASNRGFEQTTWRWIPTNDKSQSLYATGHLPEVLVDDFLAAVERANVYLTPTEIHFIEVPDSVPATYEQKLQILDRFFWLGTTSNIRTPPSVDDPNYWAQHEHPLPDGVEWVSKEEHAEIVSKYEAEIEAATEKVSAEIDERSIEEWEAKAKRYRKLGWDDEDIEAEFGPKPKRRRRGRMKK